MNLPSQTFDEDLFCSIDKVVSHCCLYEVSVWKNDMCKLVLSFLCYIFSHVNRKTQYEHPGAALKKSATAGTS